jgi:2,4-dienoyl-CoA reductase-like NADH-dependent reductase (Old Yellow Enzyme family)
VATRLNSYELAYLHVVEPRIRCIVEQQTSEGDVTSKDMRCIYHGTIVAAGGFTGESAEQIIVDGHADLVAFGRMFISNPDLPERLPRAHRSPTTTARPSMAAMRAATRTMLFMSTRRLPDEAS